MPSPLDITIEEAREIVLAVSERKGRPPQHLLESRDPDAQRVLKTLKCTREELGSTLEM